MRRAAKGPIEIVRDGNFLAILGVDETAVEAVSAVAPNHVTWDGVDAIAPFQEEARWLLQQPSIDRVVGAPPADPPVGAGRYEATYTRMHIAHASVAPSCAMALYRDGKLQVWTHSQGVYPLRAALAKTLKLDPAAISVKHVQGPGCYGHNGADDAAADAAVIAVRTPGKPVRVRWRREEEFGFEPVSPAMVVTVRAALDGSERPSDWTTEIWSGRHTNRPGSGGNLLAAEALPEPAAGAASRRVVVPARGRHPQRRAALRVSGKAHRASPDRRDAGADLFVARARRDAQCLRDRMLRWTNWPSGPAWIPLPIASRCCRTRGRGRSSSRPQG